ncbi:MAG TPA: M23 family metallopeptidase [Longimicrobiales bacterium]
MPNPYRVLLLVVLATATWGISAFWVAGRRGPGREEAPVLGALYAAPLERVETHVLGAGETLERLLSRAEIVGEELHELIQALREHKNPRHLRAGVEVTVRRWFDDGRLRAVELRINADSTVRLDRVEPGWSGRVLITPTTIDTTYVSGVIDAGRSVYQTVVEDEALDLPPAEREALVAELAEIYAYRLDFAHDIRPGDRYRLVYEREARPDGTARRRRILVAEVVNQRREYPAVYFDPDGDGRGEYYDCEGKSLQTMFRRYPVDYVRVTSSFSWRRYHPVLGRYRAHLGTDFGARSGTPVRATADGTVAFAGRNGGYGNMVKLRHALGYETRYAHLRGFARGVHAGARVVQGQVIGYVGATGLATGPHLHYELRHNGKAMNPSRVRLPGKPGVPKALMDAYLSVLEERVALLDANLPVGPQLAEASGDAKPAGGTAPAGGGAPAGAEESAGAEEPASGAPRTGGTET